MFMRIIFYTIRNLHLRLLMWLCLGIMWNCAEKTEAPVFDNPKDPNSSNYQEPKFVIYNGPASGDTISKDSISIVFVPGVSEIEYSYIINNLKWSDWDTTSTINIPNLNEGGNTIIVKSRYIDAELIYYDTLAFVVNENKGPALIMHPKHIEAVVGDTVTIEIYVDDTITVALAHIEITYSNSAITILGNTILKADSMANNNMGYIFFEDSLNFNTLIFDVGFNPENTTAGWNGINLVSFDIVINNKFSGQYIGFNETNCELRYFDINKNNKPKTVDVILIVE